MTLSTFGNVSQVISAFAAAVAAGLSYRAIRANAENARKQRQYTAWVEAQRIYTEDPKFEKARGAVFNRLPRKEINQLAAWGNDKELAIYACRKFDKLAHILPFLDRRRRHSWDEQFAKAWSVLKAVVDEEREGAGGELKWVAFEKVGTQAWEERRSKLPLIKVPDGPPSHC